MEKLICSVNLEERQKVNIPKLFKVGDPISIYVNNVVDSKATSVHHYEGEVISEITDNYLRIEGICYEFMIPKSLTDPDFENIRVSFNAKETGDDGNAVKISLTLSYLEPSSGISSAVTDIQIETRKRLTLEENSTDTLLKLAFNQIQEIINDAKES